MNKTELQSGIGQTAFAFRGYNVSNLGRSDELLRHAAYGPVLERHLLEAGEVCAGVIKKKVDLVGRVRHHRETTLRSYSEAISLVVAQELAQVECLREFHGVCYDRAKLAFGYSLGELAALACSGVLEVKHALRVPLAMSKDCAKLAEDTKLGVLFSRGPALSWEAVYRLCLQINSRGQGIIGVSTVLSPNTYLLIGQGDTLEAFKAEMAQAIPAAHLRVNPHHWPPLHTPIMWQRNIPNRAADMMHTMEGGFTAPKPPVISMVTGKMSYNDYNARQLLHQWVDHPQRLWDAIYETLNQGVRTVIHVGPEPNLVPATFKRLSENVLQQASKSSLSSIGLRAISGLARRQWLAAMLPSRTALLRAPGLRHVSLEHWLLEQKVE